MKKYLWVDPPSGWMYGFPKGLPDGWERSDESLAKFLRENGYPEVDIPIALKHSRFGFNPT
jgi:hypothetical protein